MSYPGQPCSATVTFTDGTGALINPFEVKFSVTGPGSAGTTVYRVGVDANATVTGTSYTCTFVPTRGGTWYVEADAYDSQGRSIEAVEGTIVISNRLAPIPLP